MVAAVGFFISGHGFGHASRQIEIVNALGRLAPSIPIVIRTSAAGWLFDRTVQVPITRLDGDCDTGAVQIDSLRLDEDATVRRAAAFHDDLERRAAAEAALLRDHGVGLVVADAPPLACLAAARAGIPSTVVANFTWDWIYEYYAPHPLLPPLLDRLREAYALADEAWRLPLHGGFAPFRTVQDFPFVARHATLPRPLARERLGLPAERKLILVSFGGFGLDTLPLGRLDCLDEYGVIVSPDGNLPGLPAGVHAVGDGVLRAAGARYEDLVAAADVVLSKPGYGIVSECIANGPDLLYTSRGRFAEYDVMVASMPAYLRCGHIDLAALLSGAWLEPLRALAAAPAPPQRPPTDGANRIASAIVARIGRC